MKEKLQDYLQQMQNLYKENQKIQIVKKIKKNNNQEKKYLVTFQ